MLVKWNVLTLFKHFKKLKSLVFDDFAFDASNINEIPDEELNFVKKLTLYINEINLDKMVSDFYLY